jgi:hypothetical protein
MGLLPVAVTALLVAGAVAAVAAPFVRGRGGAVASADTAALHALERRDRALAALSELEFDHRTGKITDGDYAELLGPLRAEAADALRAVPRRGRRR